MIFTKNKSKSNIEIINPESINIEYLKKRDYRIYLKGSRSNIDLKKYKIDLVVRDCLANASRINLNPRDPRIYKKMIRSRGKHFALKDGIVSKTVNKEYTKVYIPKGKNINVKDDTLINLFLAGYNPAAYYNSLSEFKFEEIERVSRETLFYLDVDMPIIKKQKYNIRFIVKNKDNKIIQIFDKILEVKTHKKNSGFKIINTRFATSFNENTQQYTARFSHGASEILLSSYYKNTKKEAMEISIENANLHYSSNIKGNYYNSIVFDGKYRFLHGHNSNVRKDPILYTKIPMIASYNDSDIPKVNVAVLGEYASQGITRCYKIDENNNKTYLLDLGNAFQDDQPSYNSKYFSEYVLTNGHIVKSSNCVSPLILGYEKRDDAVKITENRSNNTTLLEVDVENLKENNILLDTLDLTKDEVEIYKDNIKEINQILSSKVSFSIFKRELDDQYFSQTGILNKKNNFKTVLQHSRNGSRVVVIMKQHTVLDIIDEIKKDMENKEENSMSDFLNSAIRKNKIKKQYTDIVNNAINKDDISVVGKFNENIFLTKNGILNTDGNNNIEETVVYDFTLSKTLVGNDIALKVGQLKNIAVVSNNSTTYNDIKYLVVRYANGASFACPAPSTKEDHHIIFPRNMRHLTINGYNKFGRVFSRTLRR